MFAYAQLLKICNLQKFTSPLLYCCYVSCSAWTQRKDTVFRESSQRATGTGCHQLTRPWYGHRRSNCTSLHKTECNVYKFGELFLSVGRSCDVTVSSLNPQLYIDQNLVLVNESSSRLTVDSSSADGISRVSLSESNRAKVPHCDEQQLDVCNVEAPIKYDIHASVGDQSKLKVDFFHNDRLDVTTTDGDCIISDIQTGFLNARTSGGCISCVGLLQGDAWLETKGSGHVDIAKSLCRRLNVTTESGNVHIDNLYADQSTFATYRGNIAISKAHRAVAIHIQQEGNIKIESLDGSLEANVMSGNVNLLISQHESVNISVQSGDITVKVPISLNSKLDLKANSVSIDEQLDTEALVCTESTCQQHCTDAEVCHILIDGGCVGQVMESSETTQNCEPTSSIRAHTQNGSITILCEDWISSLKLGRFSDLNEND